MDKQIGLELNKYDVEELRQLNSYLVQKVNSSKMMLSDRNISAYKPEEMNKIVISAYHKASQKYPFLNYSHLSVKPSLWSGFMSYAGINGYYNPFTSETQINNKFPAFFLPYVSCHEVAHQLGYAKEMEANFAGYLVAMTSEDYVLRYSAYLDMFLYANDDLRKKDSVLANHCRDELSFEVKKDLKELKDFYNRHKSFIDNVISFVFDKFLFFNRQEKGIKSYNEVVLYLIAFYKEKGSL